MKKVLLFFCFSALVVFASAQTPVTITVDDIADAGESFRLGNVNPLIVFDGADTGPDHHWDFSSLVSASIDTTDFVPVAETDPIYFFLWIISDMAQKTGADIVNAFVTIEDVFNFYERNTNHYAQTGFAGMISGIPLPISYDDPETIFEFPANYSDSNSCQTGFNIDIPGVGGWNEQRNRTNVIDGWGTIETPAGSYDVLRMRSETAVVDTFTYDVFVIPIAYTLIEYRWMAPGEGVPVLQINASNILGIEALTQVMYKEGDVVDDIHTTLPQSAFTIVQNPAGETYSAIADLPSGNYSIVLNDLKGQTINTLSFTSAGTPVTVTQDISDLCPGFYLLQVRDASGKSLTQKLIKN